MVTMDLQAIRQHLILQFLWWSCRPTTIPFKLLRNRGGKAQRRSAVYSSILRSSDGQGTIWSSTATAVCPDATPRDTPSHLTCNTGPPTMRVFLTHPTRIQLSGQESIRRVPTSEATTSHGATQSR